MTTIKELYDAGQRQFPMRGGGISPVLHIEDVEFCDEDGSGIDEIAPQFMTEKCGKFFAGIGWEINGVYLNNNALDLLPEPLPDHEAEIAALKEKLAKIEAACQQLEFEAICNDFMDLPPDLPISDCLRFCQEITYGDILNIIHSIRGEA